MVTSTIAPIVCDMPDLTMRSLDATWNYERWEKLPNDGSRYEVIDGVLYMTTAPSIFHQWIVSRLQRYIGIPAEDHRLALCFASPVGVVMPGCDPVQPDFVVILTQHLSIIHDRRIYGVPDVIVEVLSPSNSSMDEITKREAYARAELPEYIIVDPRTRTLRHYRLDQPGVYAEPVVYGETDMVTFDCLPGIQLPIGALFAGAPDTTL